jgi:hypothetical protein
MAWVSFQIFYNELQAGLGVGRAVRRRRLRWARPLTRPIAYWVWYPARMRLAFFSFADRIAWRLCGDGPTLFPLPGTSDWSLVNPLLYPQLPIPSFEHNPVIPVALGKYFWLNSEIVFSSNGEQVIQDPEPDKSKFENLVPIVGDLLVRLRHASGQATLPRLESFISGGKTNIDELPSLSTDSSWPDGLSPSHFQKYLWSTAVTAERIAAATALGPKFIPPTHEALFLDAVVAFRGNDYRRAILYATISTEVAFGTVIDGTYDRVLAAQDDERFRVIALVQAGGVAVRKDPIYERLRHRSDFNVLLHELSLYVLRRSLLAEDQALYADAKRLYSTRNQLVHSGGLVENETNPPLRLDSGGAMTALQTATALFSWLKLKGDFPLPDGEFVSYPSQATW